MHSGLLPMKCDAAVKCSAALSRGAHNLLWQQPAAAQTRSSSGQVKRSRGPTSRGSIAAAAVMSSQRVDSVQQVLDQCTGVLLDQFGVLHDGKHPYPHAAAAVRELSEAGKQVLILSNSSRRSGGTIGKLAKMGFNADWFAGGQESKLVRASGEYVTCNSHAKHGHAGRTGGCTGPSDNCLGTTLTHTHTPACRSNNLRGADPQVPGHEANTLVAAAGPQSDPHHLVQQRPCVLGRTQPAGVYVYA